MHRGNPNPPGTFVRQEMSDQHAYLTNRAFEPQKLSNPFAGPVMQRCRDAGNALFHKKPVLSHRFKQLVEADISWR